MKHQRETSLRIRLAGIAILGLFIALAAAAYLNGRQVKRGSESITADAVPGTIAAHNMRMAMSRSVGWVMVAASAQTAQSRDNSLKIVYDADVAFTNVVTQYKATIKINPAEDQALLAEMTGRFAEFQRQRMAYEALILAGDREGSADFLEKKLVPAYVPAIRSAEDLLNYNHANIITYANYIHNSVQRLYWTVAVVMVLALICAVVLVVNFAIRRRELMELRESEEKYRGIVEQSPLGIFQSSVEGRSISVNSAQAVMFGYATSEQMLKEDEPITARRYVRPEQRQEIVRAASESPVSVQREVEYRRKDGTTFPANLYMRAVRAADGTIQYLEGFIEDITERKRAEESLKLFRMLIDHANDAIEVIDPQTGRFLDVNEKAGKVHGYTREEYLALTIPEIDPQFAAAGDKAWKAHLENLRRFGFMVFETQHRRKDGSVFPVEINASYVRLERDYILAVVRDITEQKRVQEEMRATNRRYHRQEEALVRLTQSVALRQSFIPEMKREIAQIAAETLEVERVSIWRYERDRQSIVCQELFEWSKQSHSSGTVLRAGDFPAYFRALADGNVIVAHDAHRDPRTTEFSETYLRPLGISSMLDAPIHVIGSAAGVVCYEHVGPARQWTADEQTFAIAIANLVSLLLAEEERQQIEGHLRQAQKMEGIGQLAGGVAHDFNNVLAIIQMQSDLLKSSGGLSANQSEFADEISTTVQRAAALTRQLLLFSRREVFQPRDLNLSDSIINTAKMLQRILGGNIQMQLKLASQPMFIHADAGMMDQILLNLVVNARDAMPGGGRLVIETFGVEFDEFGTSQTAQARVGSFVCLSVSDTGCGIPPEILPKIFEPFFTTKDVGKGTGLGLATVFGIVQQHQGWVNVYSEPGHGTAFKIYLPRLVGMTDKIIAKKMLTGTKTGDETILLVEDDPSLRAAVRKALSQLGYRILEAPTGVKALEVWKENHAEIRLLLTDMVMPDGMTGKELGQRILQDDPKLKVIYMSGFSTEVVGKDFPLEEGVNFLPKPFQASKLAQIIRDKLDARP